MNVLSVVLMKVHVSTRQKLKAYSQENTGLASGNLYKRPRLDLNPVEQLGRDLKMH